MVSANENIIRLAKIKKRGPQVVKPVRANKFKCDIVILGVTCLFIAAKIEEIYPPKLQEFAFVTDGACSEDEIIQMELVVLKGLNWGLSPMTPNRWMKTYMQVFFRHKTMVLFFQVEVLIKLPQTCKTSSPEILKIFKFSN